MWLSGTKALVPEPYSVHTAWHTLVHAVLAGLPLLLLSDAHTLNGGVYEDTAGMEAVFSDAQAGGNGTCAFLYQAHERLLRVALQMLLNCDCTHGCSRCVAMQRCDTCESEGSLHRQAGIDLLQKLVAEAVPTFASVVADAAPQHVQMARHVYLVLSTQKSAEDVGGWQHKHLLGLGVAVTYDTREGR